VNFAVVWGSVLTAAKQAAVNVVNAAVPAVEQGIADVRIAAGGAIAKTGAAGGAIVAGPPLLDQAMAWARDHWLWLVVGALVLRRR